MATKARKVRRTPRRRLLEEMFDRLERDWRKQIQTARYDLLAMIGRDIADTVKEAIGKAPHTLLEREVGAAMDELKEVFRDGPVQINASLIALARDILTEQIKTVMAGQIKAAVHDLRGMIRKEIKAAISEGRVHEETEGPAAQNGPALPER
jgi:hypothetical protein